MPAGAKVNKVAYSFANIQVTLSAGSPLGGIRSAPFGIAQFSTIDYGTKLERAKWWGPNQLPVLRGEPKVDFTSSITFPLYWWRYILKKAREMRLPLADIEMTMAVQYGKRLQTPEVDTLTGLAVMEINSSHKEGADNLIVECPLDPMNVFYNGVDVLGNALSAA